jgi:hypothetical protein
MTLSGILAATPKHQVTLPLSGKKVEFRPFIVKEEKILLMASETKDEQTINTAVREVILACTNNTVDVMKLPTLDMEYLFLQLRSYSVGETVKPQVKCSKCTLGNDIEINLKDIKPISNKKHSKTIRLVGDVIVEMKYPTYEDVSSLQEEQSDIEKSITIMAKCINKIHHGEKVYSANELTTEELVDFLNEMTQEQFKKIINFLEEIPRLETPISFKCKHCGEQNDTVIGGLVNFFS